MSDKAYWRHMKEIRLGSSLIKELPSHLLSPTDPEYHIIPRGGGIVWDSSAIIAIIADVYPEGLMVIRDTRKKAIFSAIRLLYDVIVDLRAMTEENIIPSNEQRDALLHRFGDIPVIECNPFDEEGAMEIAREYKISVSAATYLALAKDLEMSMISFDPDTRKAGKALGILMLPSEGVTEDREAGRRQDSL